jgi:hypothetical protein
MAWSEAARRASIEARRRHKKFKQEYGPKDWRKERGWDIAGIYSKGQRRTIAGDIRAMRQALRAGRTKFDVSYGGYMNATFREAAVSTATRNFLKRRSK